MNKQQTLAVTSTSVLAAGMAHGAVVYTPANVEMVANADGLSYYIDLDEDGWIDYTTEFQNDNANKPFIGCRTNDLPAGISSSDGWTLSNTNVDTGNSDYWGAPLTLFGTSIDAGYAAANPPKKTAYLYNDYDNQQLGDWPIDEVTDGYVGLAIINGSTTNFGFAHFILDGTVDPKTLTLVGYGYETTPGVGIAAGAEVTPAQPIIYGPPVSQTVGGGEPVEFMVQALADPAPTYQWQAGAVGSGVFTNLIDNGHFLGVTTATLNIDAANPADQMDYQVVVNNTLGTAISTPPATLTVEAAILEGPLPAQQQIFLGQNAQFEIQVLSGIATGYQWRKDGLNLSDGAKYLGTTTDSLIISDLTGTDDGSYDVVVTGVGGSITSMASTLTTVPADGGAFEGAILANGPKSYYRLNETGDPFSGDVIAFDNTGGRNGLYGTSVQNGYAFYDVAGPRPSDGFPGFNADNYAAKTKKGDINGAIKADPWILNTTNVTISAWIKPASQPSGDDAIVMVRNMGGGNVCGMAFYTGNASLGYNWQDATWNWDSGIHPPLNEWSFVTLVVTPTNATVYMITNNQVVASVNVRNHAAQFTDASGDNTVYIGGTPQGGDGSKNFDGVVDEVAVFNRSLSQEEVVGMYLNARGIAALPAKVVADPVDVRLFPGQTAHFSATVTGDEPLTYQWKKDGINLVDGGDISGATTSSLLIANTDGEDVGNYSLAVTNAGGFDISASASFSQQPLSGEPYETALLSLSGFAAYYALNETENPATSPLAYDYVSGFSGVYGTNVLNAFSGIAGPRPEDGFPGFGTDNAAGSFYQVNGSRITLPALNLNTNAVTISAWIHPTNNPDAYAGIVFCRGTGTTSGLDYSGGTDANGLRTLGYHWNDGFGTYTWNSGLVPPTNQWSFVALVLDPATTNATIWLINSNGTSSASNMTTDNLASQPFNVATMIGTDPYGNGYERAFPGSIDSVGIYASALTPAQIQGLYNAAAGIVAIEIEVQWVGDQIQLSWPSGTLLEADTPNGPWTTNGGTSPYLVDPVESQKFYRVVE